MSAEPHKYEQDTWTAIAAILVVIAIVGAIVMPSGPDFINRRRQKRAMADMRTLGSSVESYYVDYGHPPMVFGFDRDIATLRPVLEPTYVKRLPTVDAWKRPYRWDHELGGVEYSIISRGRDRVREVDDYGGATTSFDRDIYFSDGGFSRWPEGSSN